MPVVITRLFDSYDQATKAVADLESGGIPHSDISIVANDESGRLGTSTRDPVSGTTTAAPYAEPAGRPGLDPTMVDPVTGAETSAPYADAVGTPAMMDRDLDADRDVIADRDAPATGAGTGATIGTVLGGGAGLLAGLGMLAIPGVGPVVAAGWLIATALGAGIGAAGGGLLGSLVGAGVSEPEAHVYAEGVRRGGTLVTVRAQEEQRANVEAILSRYAGVDAATRGNEYRAAGWERFDENAPAYTAGGAPALGSTGATPTTLEQPVLGTRPTTLTGI